MNITNHDVSEVGMDMAPIVDFGSMEQLAADFHGGAVVTEDGREIPITEGAVQQALRELESVWMKHHHHYADVLEHLMDTVRAARAVI